MQKVHFSNRLLQEMKKNHVSEAEIMDVFNNGAVEWIIPNRNGKSVRQYAKREIGVFYVLTKDNDWLITYCWARNL